MVKINPATKAVKEAEDETDDRVDTALDNLQKIKSGNGPDTPDLETSSTKTGRPRIKGGRNAFEERQVQDYLMDWYENTPDEFEVDWNDVTIIVSGRMKKATGRAKHLKDGYELKISLPAYQRKDWETIQQTIRHEAIHIFQYQEYGNGGHGRIFRKWADKFGCTQYAEERAEKPKYTIHCPECGKIGEKSRACKTTKHIERYHCQNCGNQDLFVRQHH